MPSPARDTRSGSARPLWPKPIARRLPKAALWGLAWGGLLSMSLQTAWGGWRDAREALDQRHVAGVFRIHYTAQGPDAFVGDGEPAASAPDKARGLAAALGERMVAAYRFYSEDIGLTPPLANPRYTELRAIDVHVMAMNDKKGSTGDGSVVYRYRHFGDHVPAMTISIANRWVPGGVTPQHEVFHAYQYGYTFFKNSWFLEGMARGMEAVFRDGPFRTEPLPGSQEDLRALLRKSYDAAPFWSRMWVLCDEACPVTWSDTSYKPANRLCGKRFVKTLLEEYQAIDKDAASARGIDATNWPEKEQWSEANDPWMLRGMARAIEKSCPLKNPELRDFHKLLGEIK